MLLISGGSSVGQEDHARACWRSWASCAVHGVALRPASPAGVGFLGGPAGVPAAGQPGVVPVRLRPVRRAGRAPAGRAVAGDAVPQRDAAAGAKIVSAVGRVDYVRVRASGGAGGAAGDERGVGPQLDDAGRRLRPGAARQRGPRAGRTVRCTCTSRLRLRVYAASG